jgi:hypothetical protein
MPPQLEGILPAIITPMCANGAVDYEAFRAVLEANIRAGVHGFWVAGGTGESVFLSDEENMRLAEISVTDQPATAARVRDGSRRPAHRNAVPGPVQVEVCKGKAATIHHVGANTTARAVELAKHAAAVGVDAICAVPPFFYKPSDAAVVAHYQAVAGAAPHLPFYCYNLPQSTGQSIAAPRQTTSAVCTVAILTEALRHSFGDYPGFDVQNSGLLVHEAACCDVAHRLSCWGGLLQAGVPSLRGVKHSAPTFGTTAQFVSMVRGARAVCSVQCALVCVCDTLAVTGLGRVRW